MYFHLCFWCFLCKTSHIPTSRAFFPNYTCVSLVISSFRSPHLHSVTSQARLISASRDFRGWLPKSADPEFLSKGAWKELPAKTNEQQLSEEEHADTWHRRAQHSESVDDFMRHLLKTYFHLKEIILSKTVNSNFIFIKPAQLQTPLSDRYR